MEVTIANAMFEGSKSGRLARFGDFELDLTTQELRKRGIRVHLEVQPFQVLALLLRHPGEVVNREQLQQEIWPTGTFVDFDNAVNTAVRKIRRALGDSPTNPRFVETLPKRGYRFIAKLDPEPVEQEEYATPISLPTSVEKAPARRTLIWTVLAGCLFLLIVAARYMPQELVLSGQIVRFSIEPPEGGMIRSLELSPDGLHLAYVVQSADDVRLWLRTLAEATGHPVEGAEGLDPLGTPFWSPDSRNIAYFANNHLMRVGIAGESPKTLAVASRGRSGAWNEQDEILFTPNSQDPLYLVPASGGEVRRVSTDRDGSHRSPFFLPGGQRYLFTRRAGSIPQLRLGDIANPKAEVVIKRSSHAVYVPANDGSDGFLLTVQEGALVAQRFNVEAGALVGAPFPTKIAQVGADRLMTRGLFSASKNGTLAYLAEDGPEWASALMWVDRSGEPLQRDDVNANPWDVRISPDGLYAGVYSSVGVSPPYFVETVDLGDSRSLRLATGARTGFAWYPNGQALAYRNGEEYLELAVDGSSKPMPINLEGSGQVLDISPDGRQILLGSLQGREDEANFDLLVGDRKTGKVQPFLASENAHERMGRFSPNGRWVAYSSNETGEHQIYVVRFPDGSGKRRITSNGGVTPVWRPDGSEIYFRSPDGMLMAVSVNVEGNQATANDPQQLFALQTDTLQARNDRERYPEFQWLSFDATADGERFLVWRAETKVTPSPVHVVVNWQQELETLAKHRLAGR